MSGDKKMAIIAAHGTLDWGYPPFILGSTAAALGMQVEMFFTFYGLQLLRKKMSLKVSPLGNPGMPMPMAMDKWFPVLGTAIPGMESIMTMMMKSKMKSKGIASLEELRNLTQEAGAKMIACQMSVDMFDFKEEDLIDGIEFAGASSFLAYAGDADINLFL
jgi:peroxiredoxin family protein